jgi:CheY-like chemotaxis protein
VEIHGGTIRAESAGENEGAAFIIELPAAPWPQLRTRTEDDSSNPGAPSLAGIRVLIVDDEADARYLTAVLLEHFGAEVTSVGSSAEALAAIREVPVERRPHVLLSDVGMPDEDGYNLIRKVRALAPECGGAIPAISLTGYATPDDINRALAAGYGLHLAKPVDPRALAAAIASLAAPSNSPQ